MCIKKFIEADNGLSLVVGDLRGNLTSMMAKARQLGEKTGAFDALFCMGQFFSSGKELEPYISGNEKGMIFDTPFELASTVDNLFTP